MVSVAWLKNAKKVLKYNIIGVALCILAMVPFFGGAIIFGENDLIMVILFSLTLVIIGIAVILFIKVGIIMESYNKLLQEGEYTKVKKREKSARRRSYYSILISNPSCLFSFSVTQ